MKRTNRIISLFLSLIIAAGLLVGTPAAVNSKTGLNLQELIKKFPQGAYWNHKTNNTHGYSGMDDYGTCNNPDGYTWTPCYSHSAVAPAGYYDCNSFLGAQQCCGFAKKIAVDVYGSCHDNWGTKNLSDCKPGDVVHYYSNQTSSIWGHWLTIIERNGNTVTVGECNGSENTNERCQISWNRKMSLSDFGWNITCYNAPYELPKKCTTHTWDKGVVTKQPTCKKDGVKTYTCTVCGEKKTKTIKHSSKYHSYKKYKCIKATLHADGMLIKKCKHCGKKVKSTIYHPKTIKLKKKVYTYNGSRKYPKVVVKNTKGKTIPSKYYKVKYKFNKTVGKATARIKFKNQYSGAVNRYFTIKPKSTSITKLNRGKTYITVKWKKRTIQTTGYQIQYARNKKFTKSKKTVTIKSVKITSKKIKKLKSNTKYYVRIRTYKKVNGLNYYSGWSKVKSVKTLKKINWSYKYYNYIIEHQDSIRWYNLTYTLTDDLPLALHDFDLNGIPELIIGSKGARLGLSIYTIYGGKVVHAGCMGGKSIEYSTNKSYHGIFRWDSWMSGAEGGVIYGTISKGKLVTKDVMDFAYDMETMKKNETILNKTLYKIYKKGTKELKLYYWKDIRLKGWNRFIKYYGYKTSAIYSGKRNSFKLGGAKISLKLPTNWGYKKQTYGTNKYCTFYEKNTYKDTNGSMGTICSIICMTSDGYKNLKNGMESYVYYGKIGKKYYAMVWSTGYGLVPNTQKIFEKALYISREVAFTFKSNPKAKK
ncbi:MAG: fibronectin type III domain-containing protein [Ruminococcus sp.]|nr:fibronectin type III domain-containing protein [Ruminococcus sp.]